VAALDFKQLVIVFYECRAESHHLLNMLTYIDAECALVISRTSLGSLRGSSMSEVLCAALSMQFIAATSAQQ
jgi:hypothetical protein